MEGGLRKRRIEGCFLGSVCTNSQEAKLSVMQMIGACFGRRIKAGDEFFIGVSELRELLPSLGGPGAQEGWLWAQDGAELVRGPAEKWPMLPWHVEN